jgi:hypothetical protein
MVLIEEVDTSKVDQLVAMGFDGGQAEEMLDLVDGNVEEAAMLLLGGGAATAPPEAAGPQPPQEAAPALASEEFFIGGGEAGGTSAVEPDLNKVPFSV